MPGNDGCFFHFVLHITPTCQAHARGTWRLMYQKNVADLGDNYTSQDYYSTGTLKLFTYGSACKLRVMVIGET